MVLGSGIVLSQKKETKSYSTFEICLYGMKGLFENNPEAALFNEKIFEDVGDTKFKIDDITLVKMIDNYNCDVIGKDPKGLRSYRVSLEKNSKFPYLYRILDIKGQKLISEYQWRNTL